MSYLPTLYKARVPTKQPVCAICIDRTRGKTSVHDLGYGVRVWLCVEHGSAEFQQQRTGRDFYATLGEGDANTGWTIRLYDNPLAPWIWLGAAMCALGGFVSLSDRRLRIGAPSRRRAPRSA